MLIQTREGTTIETKQEKLKMKPDNRWTIYFKGSAPFVPFFSVVEKTSLVICNGQFSFSHRTSLVEPNAHLLDTFSKSLTLPWKNWQQTTS